MSSIVALFGCVCFYTQIEFWAFLYIPTFCVRSEKALVKLVWDFAGCQSDVYADSNMPFISVERLHVRSLL